MMTRRSIDDMFLMTLAWLVPYTTLVWIFYYRIMNLISDFVVKYPDKVYLLFQNPDFIAIWKTMEIMRVKIMIPFLYFAMMVVGTGLVWLIWSWALSNGWEENNDPCPCNTCCHRQSSLDPEGCYKQASTTGLIGRLCRQIWGCECYD